MSAEPVVLAGRTFAVVALDGEPVLGSSSPDLAFGTDGRVSGRATVNRLMGQYTLEGDILRFGALATTMMAGPEELMVQEHRVLTALGHPLRVEAADGDDVLLVSDAGTTLLRPVPGDDETDGS
jgi:heat shock protein HslJ